MPKPVKDDRLFGKMGQVRKHTVSCNACKAAMYGIDARKMCIVGILLIVEAARDFDTVLRLKAKAHAKPNGIVYPCPAPEEHGNAWALTVEPMYASGIQEALF